MVTYHATVHSPEPGMAGFHWLEPRDRTQSAYRFKVRTLSFISAP